MVTLRGFSFAAAAGVSVALLLGSCSGAEPAAVEQEEPIQVGTAPEPPAPAPAPTPAPAPAPADPPASPAPPPASPEDQARADLDQLVRTHYANEDAIWLDHSAKPELAFAETARPPASTGRIETLNNFRESGHVLDSNRTTIHSVEVTLLHLDEQPPNATLLVCKTLVASGTDGKSGEPATIDNRGLIVWWARGIDDGTWRLFEYQGVPGAEGEC